LACGIALFPQALPYFTGQLSAFFTVIARKSQTLRAHLADMAVRAPMGLGYAILQLDAGFSPRRLLLFTLIAALPRQADS
jgi:hypothetical protein